MTITHDAQRTVAERPTPAPAGPARAPVAARYVLAALRIVVGWVFLWAFLDKLFGLGYATPSAKAWLDGGSPTKGFLSSATGPFAGFYHDIAGTGWANWLFMLGLAGIGTAFLLGIGTRIAAAAGAIMYLMMFAVVEAPALRGAQPLADLTVPAAGARPVRRSGPGGHRGQAQSLWR